MYGDTIATAQIDVLRGESLLQSLQHCPKGTHDRLVLVKPDYNFEQGVVDASNFVACLNDEG